MVTMNDVESLLQDGPETLSQLAEWLEMDQPSLVVRLKQLQVPACEQCRRRFLRETAGSLRYCSRECDPREMNARTRPDPSVASASEGVGVAVRPNARVATQSRSLAARAEQKFEVVWNGVGPLPGAAGAAGLGSTLSGVRFSIGKRS